MGKRRYASQDYSEKTGRGGKFSSATPASDGGGSHNLSPEGGTTSSGIGGRGTLALGKR